MEAAPPLTPERKAQIRTHLAACTEWGQRYPQPTADYAHELLAEVDRLQVALVNVLGEWEAVSELPGGGGPVGYMEALSRQKEFFRLKAAELGLPWPLPTAA